MPVKQTISIFALSVLIALPSGMARAGNIKVQNGNSQVTINRNGDIKIRHLRGRRFYRRRLKRGSAIRVPSRSFHQQTNRKRDNCRTYRSIRQSRSGKNRSYARTRTTTCQ
ncbi:hypothetical protein Riv7116_6828 [Rivularia sp. PCC 7116]|uniref:hypothetical protein n=1 Tax=Rivularia sp. PCC 7116 TaxID=373994 RepID=UPI00029ED3F1|nr:hypothetical protein [Rivularia sp. PCC 7116]AFY59144.1 hypothetical protein Riv7116_6828 [Rivularia sp. PCC 7116]